MKMKLKLRLPDMIEKKHVLVAHKLLTSNAEGEIIETCEDSYENGDSENINIGMHGVFIGYIPKSWLVPAKEAP